MAENPENPEKLETEAKTASGPRPSARNYPYIHDLADLGLKAADIPAGAHIEFDAIMPDGRVLMFAGPVRGDEVFVAPLDYQTDTAPSDFVTSGLAAEVAERAAVGALMILDASIRVIEKQKARMTKTEEGWLVDVASLADADDMTEGKFVESDPSSTVGVGEGG